MKQKLAVILCALVVATSGNLPVYAAEQGRQVIEANVSGQVQQAAEQETLEAAGAALTEKTVRVTTKTAKAIEEALELNAGGAYNLTVKLSPGTYNLDRSLYIYPNTTIDATGATLNKKNPEGAMLEAKLTNDPGGYNGNHDITIKGGTWDSKSFMRSKNAVELFRFIHCKNITIEDATMRNVPEGSHMIVLAGVQNAKISGCEFYGYGTNSDTGYKTAKNPKEAIQLDTVHNKTVVPTGQKVKWDDKPCDNVTIEDCDFHEFSRGIGSHTAVKGELHSNVKILNNTFKNLSDSAIRLYNYKDTVVKGNKITNAVEGVLIYTYLKSESHGDNAYFDPRGGKKAKALPKNYNITVDDNTISKIKDTKKVWGDGIRVVGASSRKVTGVTITNNSISTVGRYGIFTTKAPKLKISGNTITSPVNDGILLEDGCSSSVVAVGNKINSGKANGISVYKSNKVTIYGNTIASPKKNGIYLLDSNDCVIGKSATERNTVKSAGEDGISVSRRGKKGSGCSGTKIQYNNVSNAKKNGIFVCKSKKTTAKNNTISATKDGINVNTNSTSAKITDNTIKAGGTGIWLASGSKGATISKNTVEKFATKKADANGIYVYKAGGTSAKRNTVISENTISGSGKGSRKNAIKVSESAYTTMKKNVISDVSGSGIYIYKSKKNTVESNEISGTKKNGIYFTTNCNNAKVKGNTVKKTGDVPIMLYGAPSSTVTSNKVTGSRKYRGIWISQSNNTTVKSNTVKGAKKKEAVFVSGSTGCKVSKNKIK